MTYEIAPNRFYEAAGHSVMNPYKIELDLPNDLPGNDICFTITNILRQDAAYGRRTIFYFYTYIDYVGTFNLVSRSYQKQWSGDHYVDTLVGTNTVQINANGITGIYSGTVVSDVTDGVFSDVTGTAVVLDALGAADGGLQVATEYFNTPSVPYMDISCYSKNNIVTIEWDNIQGIPAGLYPSSYTMVFNVRDSAHTWVFLASMPYNSDPKKYKFGYTEALNVMTPEARQQAMADHILNVDVSFGITDPDIQQYPHIDIVNGAWFTIDMSDNSVTATDPGEGNTQYPHSNTDPGTNDSYADDDSEHDPQAPGQALSVDNLVSRSYVVTVAELQAFAAFLWTNDLQATMYANQVSPIENLLSLKRLPFDVDVQQSQVEIFLGNVNSHVRGYPTNSGHTQLINQNLKRFKVIHDSFLDYETNITIYLPYCGMQSIPTSLCYEQYKDQNGLPHIQGREFQVTYYYDIIYGTCAAELAVFWTDTQQIKHKEIFAVYNGNCGIDIPVTQSNRANSELGMIKSGGNAAVGILQSFVSGVAGILSGNPGAAVGSVSNMVGTSLREVNNQQTQERHYTTAGGFSSQVASYLSASVVVLYDSPIYTEPTGFAHENGYPTNLFLKMSSLTGYTELDGTIEIEGIACLDEERELLKQALMDGFYL